MPLTTDKKILALSEDLLKEFAIVFGSHPGFRPVHAKGILLTGTFTPTAEARALTRAPHVLRDSTPVSVRFSDSTGLPAIPDNDGNANPRGMAIRFHLAEHEHTDVIAHSTNGFPAKDAPEFLEFLKALASGNPATFLAAHPAALAFVQPRAIPASFAREAFFGISALQFVNKDGTSQFGRYRMVPELGVEHLDEATAKGKNENFLLEDLKTRIATGAVGFQILVQLPNDGDVVNDSTKPWPEDRKLVNFGKLKLTATVADDAHEQQQIIFDPIPRVDGIEPSDDPLLEVRAALYLMSGRRRRQAPETAADGEAGKRAGA